MSNGGWMCQGCGHTNGIDITAPPSNCTWCGLPRGTIAYPQWNGREVVGLPPAAPVVIAYPHETMNGVTIHAAAPLSTLPERPDEESAMLNATEFLRRMARVEEAKFTDAETGLYIPNGIPAKLERVAAWIEAQASRVSSLERELEAVRDGTDG